MKLHAYGGFHKRDGYEIADGAYVGGNRFKCLEGKAWYKVENTTGS